MPFMPVTDTPPRRAAQSYYAHMARQRPERVESHASAARRGERCEPRRAVAFDMRYAGLSSERAWSRDDELVCRHEAYTSISEAC